MEKFAALQKYFGHTAFREGQEPLIDAILAGRDVFGIMPTGGGKSVCYQLPALLLGGLTLVISPLISLMKDQVMALRDEGIDAAFLNSSLTAGQMNTVYAELRAGKYKLVYIAPERLDAGRFVSLAQSVPISLVAVDEAHCISQWGQDFRPSYLRIADFVGQLPRRPVVAAFTATATQRVREDVVRALALRDPLQLVTGFDRPNLYFEVQRPTDKASALAALVERRRGKSGIVYCATRKAVEQVCRQLCARGVPATRYHAGLSDEERRKNQEDFLYDRCPVMAATNAFGMGIDKSNVGYVIHYNMPKSLEAYYQEAGRAGRDGEPADCILLYSAGDVFTAKFLIANSGENEELTPEERAAVQQRDLARLDAMVGYCKTQSCLRGYILDYFGQAHGERCGSCGNCTAEFETADKTREAQILLSCVRRVQDRLGYSVGPALLSGILAGSRERRILELGLDGLSTYGLMKNTPRAQIRALAEALERQGYLRADPAHGALELTGQAAGVLFRGERVVLRTQSSPEPPAPRRRSAAEQPADGDLLSALKALRLALAQQSGLPAYIVFTNAALADMAAKRPRTMEEFLEVSGVGQAKAARYGKRFLAEIAKYQ